MATGSREAEQKEDVERRGPAGEMGRVSADDWAEECDRQARQLQLATVASDGAYGEFRRKLACGEVISRAAEKLAEAVKFSGRITVTFHQGKLTKTVLEESYYEGSRRHVR